ncbi:general secretion pathway protein GspB [Porticoccus sp.]
MSYILEALKESQRSREEQRVPDIMAEHAAPEVEHEKSGRGPLVWVLLLLVILAGAAGWWFAGLRSQQPPMIPEVAEREATISSPQVPEEISSPVGQVENEVAQEASLPPPIVQQTAPEVEEKLVVQVAPAVEDTPAVEAAVSLPQPSIPQPVVAVEKIQPATAPVPSSEDRPVVAKPIETPKDPVATVDPVSQGSSDTVALATANSPSSDADIVVLPSAASPVAEEEPVAPEPERIPHFRELPFDVQQAVSGVKYSVHLYSPNPERRLVKINGIVRREGSEVSPGLVLEQVTPDGAVFTYREYRFRMPVR